MAEDGWYLCCELCAYSFGATAIGSAPETCRRRTRRFASILFGTTLHLSSYILVTTNEQHAITLNQAGDDAAMDIRTYGARVCGFLFAVVGLAIAACYTFGPQRGRNELVEAFNVRRRILYYRLATTAALVG